MLCINEVIVYVCNVVIAHLQTMTTWFNENNLDLCTKTIPV